MGEFNIYNTPIFVRGFETCFIWLWVKGRRRIVESENCNLSNIYCPQNHARSNPVHDYLDTDKKGQGK
jgi:hypothetical protein